MVVFEVIMSALLGAFATWLFFQWLLKLILGVFAEESLGISVVASLIVFGFSIGLIFYQFTQHGDSENEQALVTAAIIGNIIGALGAFIQVKDESR